MTDDLEREVEQYFKSAVEHYDGLTFKWSSPAQKGVPDRIAIFPGGVVWFIEVKRTGGKLTKMQRFIRDKLVNRGCRYACVYGKLGVDKWVASKPWSLSLTRIK